MPFVDIERLNDAYLPGVRQPFSNLWSSQGREFLRTHLNHLDVIRDGEKSLHQFLAKVRARGKRETNESHWLYQACQKVATVYEMSGSSGAVNDDFFTDLQDEIGRELRLMEIEEAESEDIAQRIEILYRELHPSDNLRTIPGMGELIAPMFLAVDGDPMCFRSQSVFSNYI